MSMRVSLAVAAIAIVTLMAVSGGFGNVVTSPGRAPSVPTTSSAGAPATTVGGPHPLGNPIYTVKFVESNLPSGTTWFVNISNEPPFGSSGSTIQTALPNGLYYYNVSSTNNEYEASGGSFTVSGAAVTIPVPFTLVTYAVTFNESGLPASTEWWANISGGPSLGTTANVTSAQLTNGSYTYTIGTTNKEYAAPGGSFMVDGAAINLTVVFLLQTYAATFTEKHLPPGTQWFVNVSGAPPASSTTTTISEMLTNGSYTYTVATVDKEYAATGGSFSIHGAGVSKTVSYSLVTYTIEITETGLPAGSQWWLNITNEPPFGSTGTTITTSLPNGTYPYVIGSENKSWEAAPGEFVVDGSSMSVPIPFSLVTYAVTFNETGLPAGTQWWVNISGEAPLTSTGTSIATVSPNGTFSYVVQTANKSYEATPSSFGINGEPIVVAVPFGLVVYSISFTESGLPLGTEWFVNLTGGGSFSSTSASIVFYEPNGTYDYSIGSANTSFEAPGGSFTVNGATVSESVTFTLVTYAVLFTETGMPVGATWWVNLTNGQSFSSLTTAIAFVEPNGTYFYSIGTTAKKFDAPPGSFTIDGAGTAKSVTFGPVTQSITFTETGLPTGKSWTVVLNGTVRSLTSSSTSFGVSNGSYVYLIAGPAGHQVSGTAPSGTIVISGSSKTVSFTFVKGPTYTIHFGESGLPKGQSWCVTLGGDGQCSTTAGLSYLNLTPGSYAYSVRLLAGQTITAKVAGAAIPLSGTFGLASKGISVSLKYVYYYSLTFTERGLPASTSWSVTVRGAKESSTSTTIVFNEPNGTYAYTIGAETGYKSAGSPRPAKIVGAGESVAVTFTAKGSAPASAVGGGASGAGPARTLDASPTLGLAGVGAISILTLGLLAGALRGGRKPGNL